MTDMDIRQEMEQLIRELERANHQYYVLDAPEMPDFEYDRKLRQLEELEREIETGIVPAESKY